jgi:hypothetical protein
LVRGFRSTIRQIATGLAGGGIFNGNNNPVTVHGQKWRNYEKNATFYLALPVDRDFYVL